MKNNLGLRFARKIEQKHKSRNKDTSDQSDESYEIYCKGMDGSWDTQTINQEKATFQTSSVIYDPDETKDLEDMPPRICKDMWTVNLLDKDKDEK